MANIIVIDDHQSLLRMMRRSLEQAGHVVTTYTDGRAAIAHVGGEAPDLLITDIFMREMDATRHLLDASSKQIQCHSGSPNLSGSWLPQLLRVGRSPVPTEMAVSQSVVPG